MALSTLTRIVRGRHLALSKLNHCLNENGLKILFSNERCDRHIHSNYKRASLCNKSSPEFNYNQYDKTKTVIIGGITIGLCLYYLNKGSKQKVLLKSAERQPGNFDPTLPSYSLEDVSKHDSTEKRIWVTFRQGIYDITDFVEKHPGGDKILMAAGGSVEPFWLLYGVHKTPEIFAILESHRIGNISEEDAKVATSNMEDPYSKDPWRHPALRPSSMKPYNAEPPPPLLTDSFITPTELFYVRNHLPVPEVDEETYELEISGIGLEPTTLTLQDLKKFPKQTITASIQCAGNRRGEMSKVKAVKGLDWGQAAIGNATWSGARLYDVLTSLGLKEDDPRPKHIQFEGLDTDVTNVSYGASIPIEKGMDPRGDVILAYEMNGEPLTRDHGYPVRAVVPGVVGARNVKWLGGIIVSEEESESHWQRNDYKGFSPSVDWHNVDFGSAPAIQELPVISAVGEPLEGAKVKLVDGKLHLKGYAFSGGGHQIVRVDITADQGKTWHVGKLTQDTARPPRHWAWSLWTADIPVESDASKVEIWVKAVDNSYNTQPESFQNIWNLRGVLGNAYHRITVNIVK